MAEYGRKIIDKRSEFIKELNETVQKYIESDRGTGKTEVLYEPSVDSSSRI